MSSWRLAILACCVAAFACKSSAKHVQARGEIRALRPLPPNEALVVRRHELNRTLSREHADKGVRWAAALAANGFGYRLVRAGDRVVVGWYAGAANRPDPKSELRVYALTDGKLRWRRNISGHLLGEVHVADGEVLVSYRPAGHKALHLASMSLATGKEEWDTTLPRRLAVPAPAVTPAALVFGAPANLVVRRHDGTIVRRWDTRVCAAGGLVYYTQDHTLMAQTLAGTSHVVAAQLEGTHPKIPLYITTCAHYGNLTVMTVGKQLLGVDNETQKVVHQLKLDGWGVRQMGDVGRYVPIESGKRIGFVDLERFQPVAGWPVQLPGDCIWYSANNHHVALLQNGLIAVDPVAKTRSARLDCDMSKVLLKTTQMGPNRIWFVCGANNQRWSLADAKTLAPVPGRFIYEPKGVADGVGP